MADSFDILEVEEGSAQQFRQTINDNFRKLKTKIVGEGGSTTGSIEEEINELKRTKWEAVDASDTQKGILMVSSVIPSEGEEASDTIAASQKAVQEAYNHSVTGTATADTLGVVKLSDSYTSTSDVNSGIAATPKAVKEAYDKANTHAGNYNDTPQVYGTVLLSDNPIDSSTASQSVAATPNLVSKVSGKIRTFSWPPANSWGHNYWSGNGSGDNPYKAQITISNYTLTSQTKLDILPNPKQISILQDKGCTACVISNESSGSGSSVVYKAYINVLGSSVTQSDFGSSATFDVCVSELGR